MLNILIRRLFTLVLVISSLVIITFIITNLIPADPARMALGPEAGKEQIETYREKMGLNDPLPIQFIRYVNNLLHGDLGISTVTRQPVLKSLITYFPATMELALAGMILYIIIAIPIGIIAALNHNKPVDYGLRFLTVLGLAIPNFVLALILQLIFARKLGWFPIDGRLDLSLTPPEFITGFLTIDSLLTGNWEVLLDSLNRLVLPTIAIAAGRFAVAARFMRAGLLEVMREDYIRTARAKGLTEKLIVGRHAIKNAIIPLITVLGLQFGFMLGGIVLVEIVFNWPGLGRFMVESIFYFDFPAMMGVTILLGIIYVFVNFIVDLTYQYLDPRISLE